MSVAKTTWHLGSIFLEDKDGTKMEAGYRLDGDLYICITIDEDNDVILNKRQTEQLIEHLQQGVQK